MGGNSGGGGKSGRGGASPDYSGMTDVEIRIAKANAEYKKNPESAKKFYMPNFSS